MISGHRARERRRWFVLSLSTWLMGWASAAVAAPSFISFDPRLPNPDRPYDMTSDPVTYLTGPFYSVLDLQIQPSNPAQLAVPIFTLGDNIAFLSTFDITYHAIMGAGPSGLIPISGTGNAQVFGVAPQSSGPVVFATEMLALNLSGAPPFPEFMIRESPTLQSTGITTTEGACYGPICTAVILPIRISSFFDVFTELSDNGGRTWVPASAAIHLEQVPEPAGILVGLVGTAVVFARDADAARSASGA